MKLLELLGSMLMSLLADVVSLLEVMGRIFKMFCDSVIRLFRRPFRYREILRQLDFIGVQSLGLIAVTGLFTGMVLALQGQIALSAYGAEALIGAGVAQALVRELGPVLAALMVVGRAGSAMTAEIGSMRNTQQIDALRSMAVDPVHYLVVPRVVAATIVLPLLAIFYEFIGMVGAYFTFTVHLGKDGALFMSNVGEYLGLDDITHGLIKALVFGTILSLVCCTKGYYATGGSRGVGEATTRAVVISSLLILASDYVMTALMYSSS